MPPGTATGADAPAYLQADAFAAPPLLARWYRWFTPLPPVGRFATLKEREQIRRSRLASIILAVQLVFIELPVIPVVSAAPNHAIVLPWLYGCIAALLLAIFFNRRGNLTSAGVLMVTSIEVTVIIKMLTVPGGLSVFSLPQFDILVQPILIAVALLVPWSAFAVAGFNVLFVILVLTVGAHAPDLVAVLHSPTQVGDVFAVPIMGQILTAVFAFLSVRDLLGALKRADRAEQVAKLEFLLAESRKQVEGRNARLEEGMHTMMRAIHQVSTGDLGARMTLPQDNELWSMSKQLNLFLDRYQATREAGQTLERTTIAIQEVTNELYQAHLEHREVRIPPRRHTPLDALLVALSGGRTSETGPSTTSHLL
jgi:hypothetical protein